MISDIDLLRTLLVDWLTHDSRPVLIAPGQAHPDRQPLTIDQVVEGLLGDLTPLPDAATRALGLPPRTRTSAAAHLLRWAVDEPHGPRCRSYRAASYFIAGLDHDDLPDAIARDTSGQKSSDEPSPGRS